MMQQKRKFIDVMTVLSCLAVVTLHTNGIYHRQPTGFLWWEVNFWHWLFIFGAPAFFMISGATLMEYRRRYDTRTFFQKRFGRAVIPFLFWSLIAFGVHVVLKGVSLKEIILLPIKLMACDYMSTYWFFMALFSAYLFLPALSLLAGRRRLVLFMVGVWFLMESVYPFACGLVGFSVCKRISFPYVGGGVVYMLLGYYLYEFEVSHVVRRVLYVLGVMSFFALFSTSLSHVGRVQCGYWSPLCIVYTSALFLWLRNRDFDQMPHWLSACVDWIKPHTLGVYLMHVFVTDVVAGRLNFPVASFGYRMVGPIILIALCVLASRMIKKIPLLKGVV